MATRSCESCSYIPFPLSDTEKWDLVEEAQRQATPQLSDETNRHLTEVEKRMRAGMEAHMDECPGYESRALKVGRLLDKIAGSGRLVQTESGTRFVGANERVCNNPFLLTEEYARLADELTPQAAAAFEAQQPA